MSKTKASHSRRYLIQNMAASISLSTPELCVRIPKQYAMLAVLSKNKDLMESLPEEESLVDFFHRTFITGAAPNGSK